jgi:hypothetical protein
MLLKRLAVALGLALLLVGSAALPLAPYLLTELHFFSPHYDIVAASAPALAKGAHGGRLLGGAGKSPAAPVSSRALFRSTGK